MGTFGNITSDRRQCAFPGGSTDIQTMALGGTGANLTAIAGGLVYSTATQLAITSALTGIVQGNGAAAPTGITGTANYLPKWSATAPFLTPTSLLYDTGTFVGVNTILPVTELTVVSVSASDPRGITSAQYSTDAIGARVHFRKARGTEAVPTTVVTGDVLGRLRFGGYDGANYLQMGSIDVVITGTVAATRVPTYMTFSTATDALPSVLTERMRIGPEGYVGVATTTAAALFQVGTMRVWQGGSGTSAATGEDSTFIGRLAGNANNSAPSATNGIYNTFIGSLAGQLNTSGYAQTFLGFASGAANTTGGRNTFLGYQSGIANTIGDDNVFIGVDSGFSNVGASRNVIIGFHAAQLLNPPAGVSGNVLIGYEVCAGAASDGILNTMVGYRSGYSNTTGATNTFIGNASGFTTSTGSNNTFVGYQAGHLNTIGTENTFVGVDAGLNNVGATRSVIVGYRAGNLLNPIAGIAGNVLIGYEASQAAGGGTLNTMVGYRAGYSNTTGLANTYLGNTAGFGNTTGTFNVAIGEGAGISNVGGDNTFVGARTGYNQTSGLNNTYIGKTAGFTNITGDQNVFVGKEAGYYETGSSKLFIDNAARASEADARTKALIYGVFNAATASQFLTINGQLQVTGTGTSYITGPSIIGATTPNASAMLQVDSIVSGLLPPRMTKAQRDAIGTPANGLMLYQSDGTAGIKAYVGGAWVTLNTTADP